MPVGSEPDVRRLAQYRPFDQGGMGLRAVLADLVLAAAAIEDGRVESVPACRTAFDELWGLEVEVEELKVIIDDLVARKLVTRVGSGFDLAPAVLKTLEQRAELSAEIEAEAFREWITRIRQSTPTLTDETVRELEADLRAWLHQIIIRHGAEAALLLYPEEERARAFFDKVDSHGFDRLPSRGLEYQDVRAATLPIFVRNPTQNQRRFLAGLLNTGFYMSVLTIDPRARGLIEQQMSGQRIYLDTSFLYPVLGAALPEEVASARRLLKLTQDLGFELVVTPWTVEELRTSIRRSRREIDEQRRFVRPELAETMLAVSGDQGFNRYFWQTYRSTSTSPRDVFDRLEHFEQELERYGISVVVEGCRWVDEQRTKIGEYVSLLNAVIWPKTRDHVVLEHDVKCRLLIERLRGEGRVRLSNARYWFLTSDTKLPRFAQRVPDGNGHAPELPFCVSPSAWVQIIRALTPRTEEFDRTVVDLLTSPFVGYRAGVDFGVVREVVGRMDHFDDTSPEMALAVLTDSARVEEIENAVATEDDETVEEAVRLAYSSTAQAMREAVEQSELRVQAHRKEVEEVRAQSAAAEARATRDRIAAEEMAKKAVEEADAFKEALEERQDEWAAEKRDLQNNVQAADQQRQDAEKRLTAIETALEETAERHRMYRRLAGGSAAVVTGLALTLVLDLVVLEDKWAQVGGVVAGALLVILGFRLVLPERWAKELYAIGGLLAAVAAIAVAVAVG